MISLRTATVVRLAIAITTCLCVKLGTASAADVRVIYPEFAPKIAGKEVDWIYGDYLLANDKLTTVIAAPIATRDANLTVRQIGASIIDLTLNRPSNDQLSAFIPCAARYLFHDPSLVEIGREGDRVYWRCRSSSSAANDGSSATVEYSLADGDSFVTVNVTVRGVKSESFPAFDAVRADRTFQLSTMDRFAICQDEYFRQTLGFLTTSSAPTWKSGRPAELRYGDDDVTRTDNEVRWGLKIYPGTSPLDLKGAVEGAKLRKITVNSGLPKFPGQSVTRAKLALRAADAEDDSSVFEIQTDDRGIGFARVPNGEYTVIASAVGFSTPEFKLNVAGGAAPIEFGLVGGGGLIAKIVDGHGTPIPTKATFYSLDSEDPDFGPDSTRTFVKNCVYSVDGAFRCPLDPGRYEVHFSHGPEYDADSRTITVERGTWVDEQIVLKRVVDTTGWVSTELHSHSSPSGDNVSDQFGRVENLLCEHLEFAPCTEHNRISSYLPHLNKMGLRQLMATCSGMELTGRPLPVNHQNSFPLHRHPHTQNGGGPRVDPNPVVQIERIAMWDNGSEKLVQQNHPNLHQIYGDLDVDGKPDEGFREMLQWMDVIEVHPPQTIFEDVAANPPNVREMRIPTFQWLQLLNQGYRIPGVVNTDAHYNHHGSGWLRNWFASSTDDPAKIRTREMVRSAEAGHIIMSTGPFMTVSARSKSVDRHAIPGDDLVATDGKVFVKVRVQCPNWLDVNRVQVFVNGRPQPEWNRTRKDASSLFGSAEDVVKFDYEFEVNLSSDAHLIVGAIGEGMTMQKVMGESQGNRPPIAVSNPIFVDVDGGGFQPNGDELGIPLPRKEDGK